MGGDTGRRSASGNGRQGRTAQSEGSGSPEDVLASRIEDAFGGKAEVKTFFGDLSEIRSENFSADFTRLGDENVLNVERMHSTARGASLTAIDAVMEYAEAKGKTSIVGYASRGGSTLTGYRTWPRLGFDSPLTDTVKAKLPASLSSASTVIDLYQTPQGRSFWKTHGGPGRVTFDLSPNSKSRQMLAATKRIFTR